MRLKADTLDHTAELRFLANSGLRSSAPDSSSSALCNIMVGGWVEPSGESRIELSTVPLTKQTN